MTVSTTTSRVSFAGNGSTTTFAVGFYFLASSHLKVILRAADGTETVKTLTTDYTVSGAGNPSGGSVTMLTPPASGTTIVIVRNAPQTQDVDYQPNDPFPAQTHEQALDKLTMIAQQLQVGLDRSLKIAETDSTNLTTTVPTSNNRANKALIFGSDGGLTLSTDNYVDQVANVTAQANAAAASASAASTSAGNSAASASQSATSATASANSATAAAGSATSAASSAATAAAAAAAGLYSSVQDKSADYTVVAGDAGDLLRVSTGSGAVTINLPQISTVSDGFKIAIVKWTGDSNAVTVARSGSDTINGNTSAAIGSQYTQTTFVADFETNQWFAATSGLGSTNVAVDVFSGNGSTTGFTLSGDPGTKNNTYVYVGGVYQQKSTYSLSGTTLTFSAAPPSGTSNIEVIWTQPLPVGTPSDGTVTRAKLAVSGTPDGSKFLRDDMTWQVSGFPSGTTMLFVQTSAPTGWTKSTTHNDKALRVVSGTAGTGGSVSFTTAFASGLSAGATTLSVAQIPSHTHTVASVVTPAGFSCAGGQVGGSGNSGATGGGGSHTHTLPSFAVQYVDVIIATAN